LRSKVGAVSPVRQLPNELDQGGADYYGRASKQSRHAPLLPLANFLARVIVWLL
jgi:hypothetical protein